MDLFKYVEDAMKLVGLCSRRAEEAAEEEKEERLEMLPVKSGR